MGKRCGVVNKGKPCPYLAIDGTCLLDPNLLKEGCLALEKIIHENKDEWMNWIEKQIKKEVNVSPYKGKE